MTSALELALLGLLQQQSHSGYDLRKLFAAAPIGIFSDSPGAIYPALKRLERRGWIRGKIEGGGSLRRRRVFRLTDAGTSALLRIQQQPLVADDLKRLPDVMLRFALMDQSLGAAASVSFLRHLSSLLTDYIPALRVHLRPDMPLSGRLALEHGIADYESLQAWTQSALLRYPPGARKKETFS